MKVHLKHLHCLLSLLSHGHFCCTTNGTWMTLSSHCTCGTLTTNYLHPLNIWYLSLHNDKHVNHSIMVLNLTTTQRPQSAGAPAFCSCPCLCSCLVTSPWAFSPVSPLPPSEACRAPCSRYQIENKLQRDDFGSGLSPIELSSLRGHAAKNLLLAGVCTSVKKKQRVGLCTISARNLPCTSKGLVQPLACRRQWRSSIPVTSSRKSGAMSGTTLWSGQAINSITSETERRETKRRNKQEPKKKEDGNKDEENIRNTPASI